MSKYHIYGIGAALVDTEIEVSDSDLSQIGVEKGVMTLVDEARQHELIHHLQDHLVASKRASGGSGANSIIAASYFGASTFYSCKVAGDENGDFYLKDLSDAKVAVYQANGSAQGITGKCLVLITPDAERSMNTFLGVSETLSIDDIDEDALSQSEYAYIEGYLVTSATGRPAAVRLRELAKKHGVKTSLSLSDPAIVEHFHDGLTEMVGDGVDILFCNEAEAMQFTRANSLADAEDALKHHAKTFAITRGAEGARVFDGSTFHDIAAQEVKAIDTNGAGDMFAGAFLFGITHGMNFAEAGHLASLASAKVVSQFGPRLNAEDHTEILAKAKAS